MPNGGPPIVNSPKIGDTHSKGKIRVVFVGTKRPATEWNVTNTKIEMPVVGPNSDAGLPKDVGWYDLHFQFTPPKPAKSTPPPDTLPPYVQVLKGYTSVVGIYYY
jgi:hypothetical protein